MIPLQESTPEARLGRGLKQPEALLHQREGRIAWK